MPEGTVALRRAWFARDSLEVAPDLLNKVLIGTQGRQVRIVEVEAYRGPEDPGSHAFRGRTNRNAAMWGPPGHLYVYFVYGMHWCANIVCGAAGVAQAVLVRAGEPLSGLEVMREARGVGPDGQHRSDRDLCRGPARLCQALGITGAADGVDIATGGAPTVVIVGDDGVAPPKRPAVSARVGLSAGRDLPWRFAVPGHPGVSGRSPASRPGRSGPSRC